MFYKIYKKIKAIQAMKTQNTTYDLFLRRAASYRRDEKLCLPIADCLGGVQTLLLSSDYLASLCAKGVPQPAFKLNLCNFNQLLL